MIRVKVKSTETVTYRGVNYTGGMELEIPETVLPSVEDKVILLDLHNLKVIKPEPIEKPEEPKKVTSGRKTKNND